MSISALPVTQDNRFLELVECLKQGLWLKQPLEIFWGKIHL